MPTPLTPWGAKALELLADSEWHPREQLLEAMMPLIPPGVAFRHGETIRTRQADRHNYEFGPRKRGDDQTSVATGRRHISSQQLISLCRDHGGGARVQRAAVDGVDSFRIARIQAQAS